MSNRFTTLSLNDWRQFEQVHVDFHERLTVLTGANGAGKTTILNLLARHFGWSISLIGTRTITKKGAWRYFSGAGREAFEDDKNETQGVGAIGYSNGQVAQLRVPSQVGENYNVQIDNQQEVSGIYVTSHRPVYSYQRVDTIPTKVEAREELFQQYVNNLRQFYNPRARIESPSFRLKTSLISLATFGYGNAAVQANREAREAFEGFQEVLRQVLPQDLGFREIQIRLPDVVLCCDTGDFSIDAASGGVAALVDVAWQVHMKTLTDDSFVVVLDEPENHLHPSLQRSVLPGLMAAFPKVQFVAATHNPFVVTSVADSSVMVLDFVDARVRSTALADVDRAASANQVLMDVLGVPFPMPLWVEDEVERLVASLEGKQVDAELLRGTKEHLNELGLKDLFPDVIERLLDVPEESE